ncbi:MAG: glycosyltransferase family 2 protein [Anaerolineae bacterium]|jgi:GT2 family glycosyltransferase
MVTEDIWAVLVTYNSAARTRRCLESILASKIVPNVVVVDNDSQDETVEVVASSYPEATILHSGGNLGFGQACNIGMKHALVAGAKYLLPLNDDVRLTPSALTSLLNAAIANPDFGILLPVQITEDGGGVDAKFALELKKHAPAQLFADQLVGRLRDVYPVPVLPGAAMLVKGELVERLGGFDPLFFVYGVEYDYCLRTVISDWKVGFVPGARVHHDRAVQSRVAPIAIRMHVEDFYSTSLFILKRLDHSFVYMLLYEAAYAAYSVFLSFWSRNLRRALGIVVAGLKLLKVLPIVWLHRRWCLTREGVFLVDVANPESR